MRTTEYKGYLRISKWTGDTEGIEIYIEDDSSGNRIVEASLSLEQFAVALFSSRADCTYMLSTENMGKTRETMRAAISGLGYQTWDQRHELWAEYEVDGWTVIQEGERINSHHTIPGGYSIMLMRYVDV